MIAKRTVMGWTALLIWVGAGVARGEMGRVSLPATEALDRIDVLRGLVERNPDSAEAWTELGWLLYRYAQDSDGALAAVERACGLDAEDFKAQELAGRLHFLRAHNHRALDHWLHLLDHDRPEVALYTAAVVTLARTQAEVDRVNARMERLSRESDSAVLRAIALRNVGDSLLAAGKIDEAERVFAGLGLIDRWMIIGPFANERNAGYHTAYEPEREIDYAKTYPGRGHRVSWRPLKHLSFRGYLDFGAVSYPREQVLGYALTFVHSPEARNTTLRLGVSESVKVWLNDREVYASELERRFVPDQATIPIRLERGYNKLLVKVGIETGGWRLAVRLTDAAGEPMDDVSFSREIQKTPIAKGSEADPAESFVYAPTMMDHFERVVKLDPNNEDALYYLGLAQQSNQLRTEASKTFERLTQINGRCGDHRRLLGRAYLGDDKAEKALVEIKEGIEVDPSNVRLRLMLARFYNHRGLYRKEREVLEAIAEIAPDCRELQYQWLEHFSDRGWEELAFRKGKQLYESMPTDLRAAVTYARMCKSRGYVDTFESLVDRILKMDFTNGFCRTELLGRAVAERRYEDALAAYDVMHRLEPLNNRLRLDRAELLTSLKRHAEALEQCRLALDVCATDFAIHREIGVIEQRMHEEDEALASFRTALTYRPDDRWLREYVEYLQPAENAAFERYALDDAAVSALLAREVTRDRYPRSDSVLLLDEMVTQLFEDGSSTYRIHQIIKVLNDAGRNQWTRVALPDGTNRVERAVVIQPGGREVEATSITNTSIHFAQLQPDSLIDFTVTGYAPANDWMSREYSETFFFQSNDPMLMTRFVLLTPETKPVNTWTQGGMETYRTETFEGQTVHIWEARDVPRIQPEPNRPPLMDLAAQVRVSTIRDWESIARWEHSLIKEQFEPDHDLRARVHALTDGLTDNREKVRALANFVAQDIQYKILRGGIFGYKPNKAANVLHNEWGDCKDKATLLITMLDVIGIKARYATIRTRDVGKLIEEIPSNQCNHAIIYIPKGSGLQDDLWVDGTAMDHGIDALPWADQDVAAMVWEEDGSLTLMRTPLEAPEATTNSIALDVHLRPDGGAEVDGVWQASGQIAAALRRPFKQTGQRAERLTQMLNSFAPGSVLRDFSFSDMEDRDAPVSIEMRFEASNYAVPNGPELSLRCKRPFRATAQFAPRDVRHYDVWMGYCQVQRLSETYHIPDGYGVVSVPQPIRLETQWAAYEGRVTYEDNRLTITREFTVKSTLVPQERYDVFRRFCIALDEYEAQTIVLRRPAG